MKIGTLVGVLPEYAESIHPDLYPFIKWIPDTKSTYTIKEIGNCACCNEQLATLEEGTIGITPNDEEISIPFRFLRELLPSIENIEEFINENIGELV